jgi:hypothetical protein
MEEEGEGTSGKKQQLEDDSNFLRKREAQSRQKVTRAPYPSQ